MRIDLIHNKKAEKVASIRGPENVDKGLRNFRQLKRCRGSRKRRRLKTLGRLRWSPRQMHLADASGYSSASIEADASDESLNLANMAIVAMDLSTKTSFAQ